ncbi:DoxX family protein [Saccharothrix algeriensis]|uniref:DoxX family protein n=1 Tax=Saccharothrix algeriensis TaxID=173560 RepID=A0A8T8HT47_9PSEU|nr:DoxX family protein [Saccharothrix algeriensis]MBM7813107.1 putative oxidoreductase [Saccharothrix algeriensis]QTR01702.1 DoxX family protein [Saccharothrix algeriensis]
MTTSTDTRTTTGTPGAAKRNDLVLAAFRVVVSFLFACHGLQGFGAFGGIDGQGGAVAFGSFPGWWGSVIELVCSALVLVGVAVRPAAVLCSGAMAYAYFVHHQPTGLLPLQNTGELAAVYCWSFLLIAVLGPGSFALGRVFRR